MTTLQITPNWKNKTAKFKGTIAAGEHVAVSIANDDNFIADTTNLRLRVVNPANGKTLAQFPMPETPPPEDAEVLPSFESPDEWDSDLTPLSCELNLNTDRMLMAVPPAANVLLLFVLDDYEGKTLYFKDMCEVTHWPRRVGEEEPTNLDDYADIIEDFNTRLTDAEADVADAVTQAETAATRVSQALDAAETFVDRAESAATNAQSSAATAHDWANNGEAGNPSATNNAKYFAQQAGASATNAGNSATSASGSATSAAGSATAAEQWATGGTGGTPSATNNAKYYAEQAKEALDSKADKSTTYTKTETDNNISTAVAAEATARDIAISSAISDVVGSAPAAFDTLKEISDWIGDDQSGAAAMAAQIASHTSQLSQLSQNKVDKVAGKGLSTNDYTTAEKTKLGGVETGAKDNVVEAASASAFPQPGVTGKIYVAKDENKTYRWSGTQYTEISPSPTPVAPSTEASAAGKPADAKETGDALAAKLSKAEVEAGFTEWKFTPPTYEGSALHVSFNSGGETVAWYLRKEDEEAIGECIANEDATSLNFSPYVSVTATRTRLPKMADITYDLGYLGTPIVINTASSEVVEGETVYYGAAALANRTANIVQVTAATPLDELRITFPAATSGKVRDFGLRVEVGTGSAALTAPSLVPPAGVTLENADGAIPALADGAADAKGVTLLYFSETAPGVFVVKGEQVEEVA